jgi:hypothetical protein
MGDEVEEEDFSCVEVIFWFVVLLPLLCVDGVVFGACLTKSLPQSKNVGFKAMDG